MDSNSVRPRTLLLVGGVALLLRLALFVVGPAQDVSRAMVDDSGDYIALARNLTACGVFGKASEEGVFLRMMAAWREASGTPPRQLGCGLAAESFRTPGYPAFLALSSIGTADLRGSVLVQLLLGSISAVLLMSIGVAVGLSADAALLVGVLWALHPALIVFDNQLLTEPLFVALGVVGLWAATRTPSWAFAIVAGMALGVTSLVRPVGLLYLPAALAWGRAKGWPSRWLALLVGVAVLPPLLWTVRNVAVGEGALVSTVSDASLVFYYAPCVRSEGEGRDCDRDWTRQMATTDQRVRTALHPGANPMAVARAQAMSDVLQNPAALTKALTKSVVKLAVSHSWGSMALVTGTSYRSSNLFSSLVLGERAATSRPKPLVLVGVLSWTLLNVALCGLALLGCVSALRDGRWLPLIGALATLGLFTAIVGTLGQERFRLPMMPGVLLLAGYAWDALRQRFH